MRALGALFRLRLNTGFGLRLFRAAAAARNTPSPPAYLLCKYGRRLRYVLGGSPGSRLRAYAQRARAFARALFG